MRAKLGPFATGIVVGMIVLLAMVVTGLVTRASGDKKPAATATPAAKILPPGQVPQAEPSADQPPRVEGSDLEVLAARRLAFPVADWDVAKLTDTFLEGRGDHPHEALDILAPRGTRVVAVDDGMVKRLFTSVRGGLTVYQFDPTETYCYYYAHLDRYAPGLAEGAKLQKGDLIGYVGTTGNAPPQTPHLHFTIFKLGPERRWWEGTAVNPFRLFKGTAQDSSASHQG